MRSAVLSLFVSALTITFGVSWGQYEGYEVPTPPYQPPPPPPGRKDVGAPFQPPPPGSYPPMPPPPPHHYQYPPQPPPPPDVPHIHQDRETYRCVSEDGDAQRCVPDFVNAAFNRRVEVTNVCGETRPTQFCVQTGHSGMRKVCDICDARIPEASHPGAYLTDFNTQNETWWQSETMAEDIQFPNTVNLTLRLGKTFDITYVRLKFHSPRPESFAIYKKTKPDDEWVPWIYYSATCRTTYGRAPGAPIMPDAETVAQCIKDYSDISPLTGGNVAFSTLEGRPSAASFEDSHILQDWVTASEIKIELKRLNTFGDEVFRDEKVLQSYYYAISDFAVGGRCKCNGHSSECVKSTGAGVEKLVCRCEHNTMGEDCEQCLPFYNDRPWKRATSMDAYECKACDCNNLAARCYFDEEMFAKTGSGGHCIDCTGNTRGAHCESCLENHWRRPREQHCVPCGCNDVGSLTLQCDETGQCPCKPGVTGQFCDRCENGFYEFSPQGCKDCRCALPGSYGNQPNCRSDSGVCACKVNVEGQQCDRCKPGHFSLSQENEFGCTPCFCYGQSSVCSAADGYYETNITSEFPSGKESWRAELSQRPLDVEYSEREDAIYVQDRDGSPVYFLAPERFLGNQRASYNHHLMFTLKTTEINGRASISDIIIEGANGQSLSAPIFAQENPPPNQLEQLYKYKIHEDQRFGWTPKLTPVEFMGILANISAIKIRGTFAPRDVGFLTKVKLESASMNPTDGDANEANWVERCECPTGFIGQFCESCAPGFKRDPQFGGALARCLKCNCNNHSDLCEAESGNCICEHNTDGATCERCARGYYGDALQGTPDDCAPCPCPNKGHCVLHHDGDIICMECPTGYTGRRCDMCADGYFGKPKDGQECKLCECSGNIDPNSIGNCDRETGECKKCIYNTGGFNCDSCLAGFWGDAQLEPKGDCERCQCYAPGTKKPSADYEVLECAQADGQCDCMPQVTGRRCDECEPGYFNLTSGQGCERCNCDVEGSQNNTCDIVTGQCQCRPGVTGRKCDQCAARHFGFSAEGCDACDCEVIGSDNLQCDVNSGQCLCRTNIEGRRCDQCVENMYNIQQGCVECPPCYGLVQKMVNDHRRELKTLQDVLREIKENPKPLDDEEFENQLDEVRKMVDKLVEKVRESLAKGDEGLVNQIDNLKKDLGEAADVINGVAEKLSEAEKKTEQTEAALRRWNLQKESAERAVREAQEFLNTRGVEAWQKAKDASEKYGEASGQLSLIAGEARKLADKHENNSQKIEEFAKQALNASERALNETREAIFGGEKTSQAIQELNDKYLNAEDGYNGTKSMAEEALAAAEKAAKDATKTLADVNALELPNIDTDDLYRQAETISNGSKTAGSEAQTMRESNEPLLADAERLLGEAEYELQRVIQETENANRLLAELDLARAKALEAVRLANSTLFDAEETLKTLEEFDELIQASKDASIAELGKVTEIEKLIEEADNKTREAQKALGNAKEDAAQAEAIAGEAKGVAEKASQSAETIREDAGKTKESAEMMKQDAEKLKTDTTSALERVEDYERQVELGGNSAKEALETASQANNIATQADERVKQALEDVKRILDEMNSLQDVKSSELDALETQLDETAKTLKDARLEQEVGSLKAKQEGQQRKIAQYKSDIDKLKKEVANIEQIRDSLPDQCFNDVGVEQTRKKR